MPLLSVKAFFSYTHTHTHTHTHTCLLVKIQRLKWNHCKTCSFSFNFELFMHVSQ